MKVSMSMFTVLALGLSSRFAVTSLYWSVREEVEWLEHRGAGERAYSVDGLGPAPLIAYKVRG
jgi:hypothetical protein